VLERGANLFDVVMDGEALTRMRDEKFREYSLANEYNAM
jgi:hypothetical protein